MGSRGETVAGSGASREAVESRGEMAVGDAGEKHI
jgi:hypothetical protein